MYQYIIRRDILFHVDIGFYMTYGLDMVDEDGAVLYSIKDISVERDALCGLASLCDTLQPSSGQMQEIVEDFLEFGCCL